MTAIVCTAIVCGCALTAWVLWIRIQPRVTREEFQKQTEAVKDLREKLARFQQALSLRGIG